MIGQCPVCDTKNTIDFSGGYDSCYGCNYDPRGQQTLEFIQTQRQTWQTKRAIQFTKMEPGEQSEHQINDEVYLLARIK